MYTYYGLGTCEGTPEATWKWVPDECTKGPTVALQAGIEDLGCERHRILYHK